MIVLLSLAALARLCLLQRLRWQCKLKRFLSEKKLKQLERAKTRKIKEELLRLDNEIAVAEDAVELTKIKDRFMGNS